MEESALFTFEIVAVAYFLVFAPLSLLAGGSGRRARVAAAALVVAVAVVAASRVLRQEFRAGLALVYLVAGYWMPALLVARTSPRFEAWLRRTEKSFGSFGPFGSFGSFHWLREVWELAYLCCYPVVPAAFLTVYLNGSSADVDRFWTAVLAAGYVCYISLPWLVSRPPRLIEGRAADASRVRHLNVHVLHRVSHGWNTFPSGHVAVAFAGALAVASVVPVAGVVFLVIAVGIAIGSITGRYHYVADALAGAVVGVSIPAMLARLMSFVVLIFAVTAALHAQGNGDATRGQTLFKERCAVCHGEMLEGVVGPPLKGDDFAKAWTSQPALVDKIQKTMPQDNPGSLTAAQAGDVTAFIVREGSASRTTAAATTLAPVASHPASTFPPAANLAQLMRGIFFPSSNIIFNVQGHDPGEKKDGKPYEPSSTGAFNWADWGAGIYSPWEVVDFAGLAIADAAPLLLVPRRCENGRAAPVDKDDWNQFVRELIDAGKAAYKASQTRNQETVSDVSNQIADACLHCHERYRDKPGGTTADPSNKAARCF